MAVNLSPIGNDAPFVDSNGDPVSGGLLYTYTAGSSTPEATYTTSAGSVANANPIVLGSTGYPSSAGSVIEIWLTAGTSYKFELKTSAGVSLWTRDNIDGINDTSVTFDQWIAGPTPTYVSGTSLTLVGDQTSTFQVGRRIKTTNSGGTIYSTISVSAYTSLTTLTVVNDSGTLDSGLSAISYGLASSSNSSLPGVVLTAGSWNFQYAIADIELGHDTDTTLTRVSPGVIAVEGVTVYTQGGALGTPASGTLTNCISFPAAQGSSLVLLDTASASASATIDLTTAIDNTYDEYEIHIFKLLAGTAASILYLTVSSDTGSSWLATAYYYAAAGRTSAPAALTLDGSNTTQFALTPALSATATGSSDLVIKLFAPSVSGEHAVSWTVVGVDSAAAIYSLSGGGRRLGATIVDALRFAMSAGNIATGDFYLYGIKKA